MNATRICLAILAASLATPLAAPLASATHSLCHNGESFPDEFTIVAVPLLNQDVAIDTGTNNGAHVLCVSRTGVVVDVVNAPTGTGTVVGIRLCNGNTGDCPSVLGRTGAAIGPGTGLTCTLGTCAYVWINGVQVAP